MKYLLLVIPAAFSIYLIAPFGDRCSGLVEMMEWFILAGVFLILMVIVTGIDLYRFYKLKRRYDVIPPAIALLAGAVTVFFLKLEGRKPWTNEVFRGQVEVGDLRSAGITLYANGTFDANTAYVEFSCNYRGTYTMNGDTLLLLREELPRLTDSVFTTRYLLCLPDSDFRPTEVGFVSIQKSPSIH
ncbi:MAG TPA: hypothetical protein PK760_08295 [Flavobacteriales bacterium]|nr:hypothetical protein [Flavobacteriales bacterium]